MITKNVNDEMPKGPLNCQLEVIETNYLEIITNSYDLMHIKLVPRICVTDAREFVDKYQYYNES